MTPVATVTPITAAPRAPPHLAAVQQQMDANLSFHIDRLASDYQIDPATVRRLLTFLETHLVKNDDAREVLLSGHVDATRNLFTAAVCAWYRQSADLLTEILANRTGRAQAIRAQVLADAYDAIRARQGRAQ
jgi:hypothetical protein